MYSEQRSAVEGVLTEFPCCGFLLTDTGSVMLGKARRTLAGEATDGVNAQELTVVLFGRTFVQI